jgi:hypothetical protein
MIALKVEMIGDRVAVILTEEALDVLNAKVGGTLHLEPTADGRVRAAATQEAWVEDPHARGRAFLRRYNRTFDQLS